MPGALALGDPTDCASSECCPCPLSPDDPALLRTHPRYLPQVWGFTGLTLFASGNKMAPNGKVYLPLGSVNFDVEIGLLPQKRLYLFTLGNFWAQRPPPA